MEEHHEPIAANRHATIVGSLAAVFVGGVGSAAAAPAHPNVVPAVGGPNTRFTFVVGGFQGDPDDGDGDTVNDAEKVSF